MADGGALGLCPRIKVIGHGYQNGACASRFESGALVNANRLTTTTCLCQMIWTKRTPVAMAGMAFRHRR